ncbi:uncharacterized protein YdaU (DUF1376 family) [Nocardia transvalensis]|uniref:Uncharacterized protein YdaU (DUF1376 family) n=1 Tax=Nocardia transvalensis TaxID=37333 RepID=A0A7W9PFP2_9NOCA|nr:hypothetical protein [Nocardia transvalensis]MBB5915277.1 uncharacterized protein YdaU (DUF1376 family) [Nocardia transvalensis]
MRPRPLPLSVLLSIIEYREIALEADLRKLGIRYSDRWRFDEHGQRLLTLREIWASIQYLDDRAALTIAANNGKPRWGYTEYLLADLFTVFTRQQHPWRPKTLVQKKITARRAAAEQMTKARFARRNRALATTTTSRTERG